MSGKSIKGKRGKDQTVYKVRCSRTFASYWFVYADNQDEAEEEARRVFAQKDAEAEASHIHDTFEVEEADA